MLLAILLFNRNEPEKIVHLSWYSRWRGSEYNSGFVTYDYDSFPLLPKPWITLVFALHSKYLFVTISRKQLVFLVLPFWTSEVSVIIELIDDVSDSATHTHRRNES
ncbi:unnamed protein product [Lepeophtheirus salmonis]|uniref:(salmon louse) hypothetical protein n=1 Tax=Lepeophtheirus salmonis TaxID=72036 RepID=A0A7R8CZF4_LEPSM|nr:unnamed protein product [Lepeophtheirus salmonis]CAF2974918.1 unnamed protein product [Lepeophtheirus salmonis]